MNNLRMTVTVSAVNDRVCAGGFRLAAKTLQYPAVRQVSPAVRSLPPPKPPGPPSAA